MQKRLASLFVSLLLLSTGAFAQNVNDFMNLFGGIVQQAMRQATQSEWQRLPPPELSCLDQGLRQQGASVDVLVSRGVMPSDPRLAQLRSDCRDQIVQNPQPGNALSPYVVDGLALGGQVVLESQAYKQYHCGPSEKFSGFTWCHKEEKKKQNRIEITSSNSILHAQDGTAWYVNRYIEPAFFAPNEVQSEIDRLSTKFGEPARLFRMPQREGLPNAVIAVWGKIQLDPLNANDVSIVAAGGRREGLLVSFLGDLQRSAKEGVPVYRLAGGPGFLWAATFSQDGRGVLRFLTSDASKIEPPTQVAQSKVPQPSADPRSSTPPGDLQNWKNQVVDVLSRSKHYPAEALNRGEEGTVVLNFTLDRRGNLIDSRISKSSGSAALDREAIDLLSRTQPFPSLPSDYAEERVNLEIPIHFAKPPPPATASRDALPNSTELSAEDQPHLYSEFATLQEQARSLANDQSLTNLQMQSKLDEIKRREFQLTDRLNNARVSDWNCTVVDIAVQSFHGGGGNPSMPGYPGYGHSEPWKLGVVTCTYRDSELALWLRSDDERLINIRKGTVVRFDALTVCQYQSCDPKNPLRIPGIPDTFVVQNIRSDEPISTQTRSESPLPSPAASPPSTNPTTSRTPTESHSTPSSNDAPPPVEYQEQSLVLGLSIGVVVLLCSVGAFIIVRIRRRTLSPDASAPDSGMQDVDTSWFAHLSGGVASESEKKQPRRDSQATSGSRENDLADRIAKFAKLHAEGTLTDEEFQNLKATLVGPFASKKSSPPNDHAEPQPMPFVKARNVSNRSGDLGVIKGLGSFVTLAAILYFVPMLIEGTSTDCSALERRVLKPDVLSSGAQGDLALLRLFQSRSNGAFASQIVSRQLPALPTEIGCSFLYWRVTIDPTAGQDVLLHASLDGLTGR